MSTEVSLTIIAICVLVLVVFAIVTAIYLIQLLIVLKTTTQSVELKVSPLIDEAKKIVAITSNTSERIRNNVEMTTPLFHSIGKISSLMEGFPNRFKSDMHDNNVHVNFESKKGRVEIGDWAEWIALGIVLIQRLRK